MWTEVISEGVAVLHVYGYDVLLEISVSVSEQDVLEAKRELQNRRVVERIREQHRELRQQMEARQAVRERLQQAGYSRSEIPL